MLRNDTAYRKKTQEKQRRTEAELKLALITPSFKKRGLLFQPSAVCDAAEPGNETMGHVRWTVVARAQTNRNSQLFRIMTVVKNLALFDTNLLR